MIPYKDKRGEANLRSFLIAFILGTLTFTAMSFVGFSLFKDYGVSPDGNLTATYQYINSTNEYQYEQAKDMTEDVESLSGPASLGGEAGIVTSFLNTIRMPFRQMKAAQNITTVVGTTVGVPRWLYIPFIVILMIILSTIVIWLAFRVGR